MTSLNEKWREDIKGEGNEKEGNRENDTEKRQKKGKHIFLKDERKEVRIKGKANVLLV
jgi:hypothetical protein